MRVRRPLEESSGGLTLRTITLVAPWRAMSSRASCMLPSPKDMREMTAAVPMMMPRTDRLERSLCSHRLRTASTMARETLSHQANQKLLMNPSTGCKPVAQLNGPHRLLPGLGNGDGRGRGFPRIGLVRFDDAVAHAHHPAGPGGDVVLVRHHDDGLAGLVQLLQELHDLVVGPRIKVPGRFIGEDHMR